MRRPSQKSKKKKKEIKITKEDKLSLLEDDMPNYIEHARKSSDQLIKLTL